MLARCLRDKIPKGDYIIRASVLDRLTDNKMYYKIIEYGERVKEQRTVDKEKEKRQAKEEANKLAQEDMSAVLEQERPESKLSSKSEESQQLVDEDDDFKA